MDETTLNQKQMEDFKIAIDQSKRTFVIVAPQHVDPSKNYLNKIPCKKGIPMRGHVYDPKHESYFMPCVDYLLLGYVGAGAYLTSQSNKWTVRVPLSTPVLAQLLDPGQKADLKHFLDSYNPEEHTFHYLQLIDANESYPPIAK